MYRVKAFLTKKAGMTMTEFIDYYENRHVPLILSLAAAPPVYKRHYLARNEELSGGRHVVDFDVVVELAFVDAQAFERDWLQPLVLSQDNGPRVAEDEARFLQREQTRAYVVDEYVSNL